MIANLYLHADALKYNGRDSEVEFRQKFTDLLTDLRTIRNEFGEENTIKVSTSLLEGSVALFETKNIYDIASDLEYEEKNFIYSLMGNGAAEFNSTLEQLIAQCKYVDGETECNTVVYLDRPLPSAPEYPMKYMTFDLYEIVYGKDSWRTVRRQIMGNHPGTPQEFMGNCGLYFPNLHFHANCTSSISGYLDLIPRKIVYYLSCMNDFLPSHVQAAKTIDENALLSDFCGKYGFDEPGTRQASTKKKVNYQFSFLKKDCEDTPGNYKTITCDPHMKMSSCDNNCKKPQNNFVGRIYFHFGDAEVAPGKILIGSIGPHL